ncbi:spo11/DNA topoisomerase VI subunit A [Artemisia annua]|uniref:DNA topoisomerase (ATP-hydrolyzing) n=1 Tax=Artemisia annua TaxID=35608 RepID=A0A2U1PI71_ARTAN|nr:spo11/DNA topoisomerase VI subunit A [Artemisia annua]
MTPADSTRKRNSTSTDCSNGTLQTPCVTPVNERPTHELKSCSATNRSVLTTQKSTYEVGESSIRQKRSKRPTLQSPTPISFNLDDDVHIFIELSIVFNPNVVFIRSSSSKTSAPSKSKQPLDRNIMNQIKDVLDESSDLVKTFRRAREAYTEDNEQNIKIKLIAKRGKDGRQYDLPTANEVAGLIVGDVDACVEDRDIVLQKRDGPMQRINIFHPMYLALQYPLLMPCAQDGYTLGIPHINTSGKPKTKDDKEKTVTMKEWFSYQIQDRPNQENLFLRGGLRLSDDEKKNITLFWIEELMRSRGTTLRRFPEMPYPDDRYVSEFGNRLIYDETHYNPEELQHEYVRLYFMNHNDSNGVYNYKALKQQSFAKQLIQHGSGFTQSIIEDISKGHSPVIRINRFRNYCSDPSGNCYCSHDSVKGVEILTLHRECYARRVDVLLRVLLIVQQLLQENRHGSKRDIYYMHPSVFRGDSLVSVAKGWVPLLIIKDLMEVVLVMGWLRFSEGDRIFNCLNHPDTAHSIPVHVEEVKDIMSVADYILVVEKESVFQRLANDCFCKTNRCIVITGRGYPDIPTRRFLRLLVEKLHLPVYCLVDCDPYGFDILTTYRFGSLVMSLEMLFSSLCGSDSKQRQQMAYDAKIMRLPEIQWLGVFPSDAEKYSVPQQCLLPMTEEGVILHALHDSLLESGVKFEIEALSVHSLTFLSKEYLPSKIRAYGITDT